MILTKYMSIILYIIAIVDKLHVNILYIVAIVGLTFSFFLHSVIRIIYFSGQEAYQQFLEALRHCGSDFIVNQLESTDASLPKAGVYS